jgi:hypothetical protein
VKELSARIEFFRTDNKRLVAAAPPSLDGSLTASERERHASLGYGN